MSRSEAQMIVCTHCGGEYKDHHFSKKAHAKSCEGTAKEIGLESGTTTVTPSNDENKSGNDAGKEQTPEIRNEEDRKLFELAQRSNETRREAPELYISGQHSDERRELIKRYAPECIDPPYNPQDGKKRKFAAWHPFWSDGSNVNKSLTAGRGYIPIFNEHGEHVTHKGDKLWKIQTKMYLDSKFAASAESKGRRRKEEDEEMEDLRKKAKKDGVLLDAERKVKQIE